MLIHMQNSGSNPAVSNRRGTAPTTEIGASLTIVIGRINRNYPKGEALHGNISNNQPAPVTWKDKINIRIKAASD